ncbi:zinc ribbon domain-containing protein [Geotalea sp. SG265]|uniref:zinc ribbon domain-containing protein n=1 Tax=Geotalea sp. SG265 TaxID=2922867 RepID=UPI001FAF28CF|nr:zinc ribbon domain-containing protein [Geotalea sp. SG265]
MINAERNNVSPSVTACPKCAAPSPAGSETCPYCGVIFAKIRARDASVPEAQDQAAALPLAAPQTAFTPQSLIRAAFLILLGFYSFRILSHSIASNFIGESFLHLVNLPFHEAGHVIFSPFGRFIQVAGGTIMQLLVPAAVAVSFFMRGDRYGAAIGIWWLGESMADVAPYADDARAGQLPLLGGVTGSEVEDYHDWEIMLGKLGLLPWDHAIGRFFFVAGGIAMTAALIWGFYLALCKAKTNH